MLTLLAGDAADVLHADQGATRAYLLNVANGACTKLAEKLAGPDLVLPWLLGAIGAPAGIAATLMPAKQTGSLLPQLLVSGAIRAMARRKWVWVAAGLVQAVCLFAIAAALFLPPAAAGWSIAGLLLAFSIASGCGSVAFQDVTPKTVPKGARGRMLASRAAIGGVLTLAAGVWLSTRVDNTGSMGLLLTLVVGAGLLWALAALFFAGIPEAPSDPGEGRDPRAEIARGMALLRRKSGYRKFLMARAALLSIEVATPFYVLHVREVTGGAIGDLGLYMIAFGIAAVVSSPFWGAFADTTAKTVMVWSAVIAAVTAGLVLVLPHVVAGEVLFWAFAPAFLALGVAEAGVRLGRKTYLADGAPTDERPLYAAFANTATGLVAIGFAGLGIVAEMTGVASVVGVLGAISALAIVLSLAMPQAERMAESGD